MNRRNDLENAVGFDNDVEILDELLRTKGQKFISIVGECGAGKRTLMKVLRPILEPDIDVYVWFYMMVSFSTEDVLEKVYEIAWGQCEGNHNKIDEDIRDVGDKLRDILSGRRYLLILGGISSKTTLNCLRASLPELDEDSPNGGGRVILLLDTENEEIAWHANTMNKVGTNGVHVLTPLDKKESGELFHWKVLRKGQEKNCRSNIPEENQRYEEAVYRITGGYPMAIVLLAGILRFKEKPVQWDAVLQQLYSGSITQGNGDGGEGHKLGVVQLSSSKNKEQLVERHQIVSPARQQLCSTRRAIEIIFWESFEDLPNDLKSCFLYLAAYRKDTMQFADPIVRMWIGEGFIKPCQGKTLEELGQDYLKELALRCLIEVEMVRASGNTYSLIVHNRLKGFLQSEIRESSFMEIHDIHDVLVPPSVRRLSIQSNNSERYTATFANKKFPKLRSFICNIDKVKYTLQNDLKFLHWSKFLRVISIGGLSLKELPDEIGDMIQLRYLRVGCWILFDLPSNIAKLLNLQTLDISETMVEHIHQDFWKIKTLQHVLARRLTLPSTISVVEEGQGGGELQTLQGVKPVGTEDWSEGNCPLDKMTNLQSLDMDGFIKERHGDAVSAALRKMPLLEDLRLRGDEIPSCVFTDPKLRSLQTMVLAGKVNWDDIIKELPEGDRPLRKVRPNLTQLRFQRDDTTEMPQSISKQLEGILIQED
ncbi:hypothetical protein ACQ4PT_000253 [Festuca glaucescens]